QSMNISTEAPNGHLTDRENHGDLRNDQEQAAEHFNLRLDTLNHPATIERVTAGEAPPNPDRGGRGWRTIRERWRTLLMLFLILTLAPAAPSIWRYLQSYEVTDDDQIDGHIDPLSSRVDGTVIAVLAEDDDRVTKGQLLVEIDPRDYQIAVEQARAGLALANARVASARQDHAAAL